MRHNKVCQRLLIVEKRKEPEGHHRGLRKQVMDRLVKLDCSLLKSRWLKGPLHLGPQQPQSIPFQDTDACPTHTCRRQRELWSMEKGTICEYFGWFLGVG